MNKDLQDKLDRARAAAKESAESVGERAKAAGRKASGKLGQLRTDANTGVDRANRLITEHPVAAIAGAIAVGALAAYLFPKTARAVRKNTPKMLNAAASAGREAREIARVNLPIDEAEDAIEQFAHAARKANAAAADMAKAGLANARSLAVEAARRTEIDAHAQTMLDTAAQAASKVIAKVRKASRPD